MLMMTHPLDRRILEHRNIQIEHLGRSCSTRVHSHPRPDFDSNFCWTSDVLVCISARGVYSLTSAGKSSRTSLLTASLHMARQVTSKSLASRRYSRWFRSIQIEFRGRWCSTTVLLDHCPDFGRSCGWFLEGENLAFWSFFFARKILIFMSEGHLNPNPNQKPKLKTLSRADNPHSTADIFFH